MKVVLFWLFHWWREVLKQKTVKYAGIALLFFSFSPVVLADKVLEPNGGSFDVFPGMKIAPRLYDGSLLAFDFYNDTSLWYGLSDQTSFRSPISICKSFLSPSLIMPKANWIDLSNYFDFPALDDATGTRTMMPLANVDCNLTTSKNCPDYCTNSSSSPTGKTTLTVFYNNPYAWIDTPSVMNLLTLASIAVETIGIDGKHSSLLTKEFTETRETVKVLAAINPQDKLATVIAVLGTITDLLDITTMLCDIKSDPMYKNELSVQQCDNFLGNLKAPIEKLEKSLESIKKYQILAQSTSTSSKPASDEIKTVVELISQKDAHKSKASILRKISAISLKDVAKDVTDELATRVIQKMLVNRVYPDNTETMNYEIAKKLREYLTKKELTKEIREFRSRFIINTVTGGDTSYVSMLEDFASFATFFHNVWNLRESILDKNTFMAFFEAIKQPLFLIAKEKIGEAGADIFANALANNLGVIKAWKLASTAGKGSKIAWDYVTKPDIIHIDVKRTDHVVTTTSTSNIPDSPLTGDGAVVYESQGFDIVKKDTKVNFTFTHLVPELEVVRYIKVKTSEKKMATTGGIGGPPPENYPNRLVSYASLSTDENILRGTEVTHASQSSTTTEYLYYPVYLGNNNHFLVEPGFETSVEAHGIFRPDEKENIKLRLNEITLLWHTYRYQDNLITIPPYPVENRFNFNFKSEKEKCINSFDGNCILEKPRDDWFYTPFGSFKSPTDQQLNYNALLAKYLADEQDKLNKNGYLVDGSISYLDFSKAYESSHVGNLIHQNPGVYSNFAGILVGGNTPIEANQFANAFNVYVLNDYSSSDKSHFKNDFLKSSCVWSGETGNYLNIATEVLSPYYVAVKSGGAWIDIKENGIPHQRVKLNSLDGTVYVYDYILRAWENTVLKGEPEKFQSLLEPPLGQPSKLGNHIISFKLSDVNNRCPFSDVPVNQWYTKAIVELKNLNIIEGRENGSFGLNNPVSRAEFLKMAMLAADSSKKSSDFPQTKTGFSDVESHWASGYIDAAHKSGIISGILLKSGKSVFEPENVVNRAAAAKMTAITFGWIAPKKQRAPLDLSKPTYEIGYDLALNSWDYLSSQIKMACPSFYDVKNGEWYCQFISILNQYEIMTGSLDKTSGKMVFRPGDQMPREEAATAICRAYYYKKLTKELNDPTLVAARVAAVCNY